MAAPTDQVLGDLKRQHQMLADLCRMTGYIDGAKAHQATVSAISEEQAHRSRGGQPRGG